MGLNLNPKQFTIDFIDFIIFWLFLTLIKFIQQGYSWFDG
jgi:hypothetical protein